MLWHRYRMLNERKGMFGLYFSDYLVAAVTLSVLNFILENTRVQILSFIIPAMMLFTLAPIRKMYRKGMVRSYFKYKLQGRVIHDPKSL